MASAIKSTKGLLLAIYRFVVSVDHVGWRTTSDCVCSWLSEADLLFNMSEFPGILHHIDSFWLFCRMFFCSRLNSSSCVAIMTEIFIIIFIRKISG
jgi:hypothetical protein